MDRFTSDLHFGHGKLATLRGFSSVEEHDDWLVGRINAQAKPGDKLYIIGDFSFHKPKRTVEILQAIYPDKIVVKGNHDHREKNAMGALLHHTVMGELEEFHTYLERTFTINPEPPGQLICMFHFPMMHWHKQQFGSWQLHGHLHGNPSGVPGKVMDVGWDKWGRLLSLKDITEHMLHLPVRGNHHVEVMQSVSWPEIELPPINLLNAPVIVGQT